MVAPAELLSVSNVCGDVMQLRLRWRAYADVVREEVFDLGPNATAAIRDAMERYALVTNDTPDYPLRGIVQERRDPPYGNTGVIG